MPQLRLVGATTLAACLVVLPALAQPTPPTTEAPAPAATAPASPAPASPAPAAPAQPAPASAAPSPAASANSAAGIPGVVATTNNPNLAVATVKLENGVRASKLIGATVRGDGDQDVGKIDDLIMTEGNKVTVAIVAVGGFLGLGSKLVAFPYDQLKLAGDRVLLPGVTKDSLNAMPSFQY